MPVTYSKAEPVERIAKETVIPKWHPHLVSLPIRYEFASELPQKNGRLILAKTKKSTPMEEYLCGAKAFLIVDKPRWALLSEEQRVALIDHELCHIVEDKKNGGFRMQGHDVEEFTENIQRHGAWKEDIQHFLWFTKEAQLELFRDIEDGKIERPKTLEEMAEEFREVVNQRKESVTITARGRTITIHPEGMEPTERIPDGTGQDVHVDKVTGEVLDEQ